MVIVSEVKAFPSPISSPVVTSRRPHHDDEVPVQNKALVANEIR
jgi:hypothetical protein